MTDYERGVEQASAIYKEVIREYVAENAKLREERDMYRDLVDHMVHPDIPDQLAAENAQLRTQLADVTASMGRVEERCAKLRKACAELAEFLTEAEWLQWPELRAELRELGVEMDDSV